MSEPDAPAPSLANRATRAFGWSFVNAIVGRLGTLAIGIVLARVLGPHEFGVFAIAMVTLLAVLSFNELGVSLAIVRWEDEPASITPTVNTISVGSSALLTAAIVFGAPFISTALGDVRATPVVQVLGVSILINGLVAAPAALLQREFRQGRRMVADQVNTWLGALVSLGCALAGMGAMSLAVGRIAGSLGSAVLFWIWSPLPYRFGWDRRVARKLFAFGMPLAAASIVVFASGYADQVVTGSMLGAQQLGFYALAFNLASWPVSIFSQPLRAVAPAAFARLQHDPVRMGHNFVLVLGLLSAVALPACWAIAGAATPVVGFVYGAPWAPAAAALVWLAAQAACRIWFELAYDYLVVLGRSGALLIVQLIWFAVSVPAMILGGLHFGIAGIAGAQFAVAVLVALPLYAHQLVRAGVSAAGMGRAVVVPALAGVAAGLLGWGISVLVANHFLASALAGVASLAIIAGLAYRRRHTLALVRGRGTEEPA